MKVVSPHTPLDRWALSPDVRHLNHGSYGGCPIEVIDAANAWRARLEAAPMQFLVLEWQAAIDRTRELVARFLNAAAARLAFVPNATTGVAVALASSISRLDAGDELLTTEHAYRACKNQLARLATARGARVVVVPVALPYEPDALVDGVRAALSPRTKVALLDHVTSSTALVTPLDRIVPLLAERGVSIVVDGAHAPGQLELDVGALFDRGVTWYVGNFHKWACAPKASGFLAASAAAPPLEPVVTSHGASLEYGPPNRFHAELDWMGTHDPTPHLCVPTALATVAEMGNGWTHVVRRNHALVLEMCARLGAALGTRPLARDEDLGTMAALPIALPAGTTPSSVEMQLLADGWEVPIIDFAAGPLVRISAHLYNYADEADALAEKLRSLGIEGR